MPPIRTCVGCRRTGARTELVRYVVRDGVIARDETKSATGRGAWLHDEPTCRERATKRRALARALRLPG